MAQGTGRSAFDGWQSQLLSPGGFRVLWLGLLPFRLDRAFLRELATWGLVAGRRQAGELGRELALVRAELEGAMRAWAALLTEPDRATRKGCAGSGRSMPGMVDRSAGGS